MTTSDNIPGHRAHLLERDQALYVTQQQVEQSHPFRTGDHGPHNVATVLVGERHSKGDLVDLVTHLLTRALRAERTLQSFVQKVDIQLNGLEGAHVNATPATVLGQMRRENIKSVVRQPSAPGITYAIGRPDGQGGVALLDGPTPNITDMLSVYAEDGAQLLRLDAESRHDVMFVACDGDWQRSSPDPTQLLGLKL